MFALTTVQCVGLNCVNEFFELIFRGVKVTLDLAISFWSQKTVGQFSGKLSSHCHVLHDNLDNLLWKMEWMSLQIFKLENDSMF